MKFIYLLANFSYYVFFIFSSDKKFSFGKRELFLAYLRFYLKYLFLELLLRRKIEKEKLFDVELRLLKYLDFICMFEEIFIRQVYFFKAIKNKPLIFDCGANIGISVIFFKLLYPNSRIIAFEPDKKAFSLLESNVKGNKLGKVKLFNEVLNDKEGQVKFYFNPQNRNFLSKSIIRERTTKTIAFEKLAAVKLSTYIKDKIDFLKMDIEGAEGLVIRELFKKQKLNMVREAVVEFHHHIDKSNDNFGQFLKVFEENGFGYQLRSVPRTPFIRHQFQDILLYVYKKSNF